MSSNAKTASCRWPRHLVTELGRSNGFEVVCEKDGRVFLSEVFPKFDGFLFETQGDLPSEKSPDDRRHAADGKKALLDAIAGGKGFVGCHCASDTFHSKGRATRISTREQSIRISPWSAANSSAMAAAEGLDARRR